MHNSQFVPFQLSFLRSGHGRNSLDNDRKSVSHPYISPLISWHTNKINECYLGASHAYQSYKTEINKQKTHKSHESYADKNPAFQTHQSSIFYWTLYLTVNGKIVELIRYL